MSVYLLSEAAETEALLSKFISTEESQWRAVERKYSKTFFTPLHEVRKLDPYFVLLSIIEDDFLKYTIHNEDHVEFLIERMNSILDPDYDANREKEEDEYNRKAVEEEELRLEKIKAKKEAKDKKNKPKELPKSGGINLAYLSENQDNEG